MHEYESELSGLFWEALEAQYGLRDGTLYEYLVLRSFTTKIQKGRIPSIDKKDIPRMLLRFILDEWGYLDNETTFMGQPISQTNLSNVTVDWHARYGYLFYNGDFEKDIVDKWNHFLKQARSRQSKWTKKSFYKEILQKEYLKQINEFYHIQNLHETTTIQTIEKTENASDYSHPLRLEVKLERMLHPHLSFESHDELLTEKRLEDYLYKRLDMIEPGLRPIQRQYILDNGRIDILAKDVEGKMVIIEVKVESDTDLVWQESYYSEEIEKRFGVEKVRFIAVVPKYEPHIMNNIVKKKHCKIFSFNAVMKGTALQDILLKQEGVVFS